MLDSIINPILDPLLKLPVLYSILIISFLLAVIITLAYKWMTDQELMKTLKADIKGFQKQMKEFKHDPQKVMEIQKKSMEKNMKYMMHSMKPTLITFLPIIIIFGWLNTHLAYAPIMPGQEFSVTMTFTENFDTDVELRAPEEIIVMGEPVQKIYENKAIWRLKGNQGEYTLEFFTGDNSYTKDLIISTKQKYAEVNKIIKDGIVESIMLSNDKLKPLNLFGWKLGWLGTYIIFSIVFSISLRKILKIH